MFWQRKKKWHYFDTGLMALNASSATFLKEWYHAALVAGEIATHFEVIDLQRYRKISSSQKVQSAMQEKAQEPFVFFPCKN